MNSCRNSTESTRDSGVEAISPGFDTLSTWKYSLGANYTLGDDWLLSADIIYSDVRGWLQCHGRPAHRDRDRTGWPQYLQLSPGRRLHPRELPNQGDSTVITLDVAKSWETTAGLIDATLGYTRTDVDEVRSYNRFITFESYAFDATTDFNNMRPSTSTYEIEDRFTATLGWSKNLFGDNRSSASLVYLGNSGRHYSYTFGSANAAFGGTFLADFGSEGDNPGSHLFYVPTGISDPIVTGDPAFLANLDGFIEGNSCLKGHRGSIIARNACETGFTSIVSLRLSQEIGLWSDKKLEVMLDIENLGNLLDDDWGRVESYASPSNVALANVSIAGAQYVYSPVSGSQVSPETIAPRPAIARLPSVYRIQFGVRFRF